MANSPPKVKALSIFQQRGEFRKHLPSFEVRIVNGSLIAVGYLQPTAISANYKIRVAYRVGKSPAFEVIAPELQRRNGEVIPHMYRQKRLCLYEPGKGYWSPHQSIAATIVPWASLWLYYYELWHATGKWLGGGHEPSLKDSE